ncbi:MAG: hypothetical protein K2K41_00145 [Ruminiclostridium sp.]|nr:hypothetical protein [Ruminiclostridium sp.]
MQHEVFDENDDQYSLIVGGKYDHYTLTNKKQEYESEFLLYDALKYIVDGKKSDNCIIPADGKEHIVEIDYNYLDENDIEQNGELEIDFYHFMLQTYGNENNIE